VVGAVPSCTPLRPLEHRDVFARLHESLRPTSDQTWRFTETGTVILHLGHIDNIGRAPCAVIESRSRS